MRNGGIEMMVAISVQPSQHDGGHEQVRLADIAHVGEIFEEFAATARHHTKVREQYHRATRLVVRPGKMLA